MVARRSTNLISGGKKTEGSLEDYSDLELTRLACNSAKVAWDILYLRYWDFLWWFVCERLKLPRELEGATANYSNSDENEGKTEEISGAPHDSKTFGSVGRRGLKAKAITAEELVHEVYDLMWRKKKFCSYRGSAEFKWWYATVVTKIFIDLHRRERKAYPPGTRVSLEEEED